MTMDEHLEEAALRKIIADLQESNDGLQQTNIEAYDRVKQLTDETHDLGERLIAAEEENQRLKGLLKEWIDQFGYPGKSLTNDTLDAIKQKP